MFLRSNWWPVSATRAAFAIALVGVELGAQVSPAHDRQLLAPNPGPAYTRPDSATIDGCASLYGSMVAVDTIELLVKGDSNCAAIDLELVGPARRRIAEFIGSPESAAVDIEIRAINRTAKALRLPLYLYPNGELFATLEGQAIPYPFQQRLVRFDDRYPQSPKYFSVEPYPAVYTPQPHVLRLMAVSPGLDATDSLVRGGASGDVVLKLVVSAAAESFRLPLVVRAYAAGRVLPAQPPDNLPSEALAGLAVAVSDSVPGEYYRDLIRIRFRAEADWAARQRVADQLQGALLGGLADRHGKVDYIFQVPGSPNRPGFFSVPSRLNHAALEVIEGKGVVLRRLDSLPPGFTAPMVVVDTTTEVRRRGVAVFFANGVDSTQVVETLVRVGVRNLWTDRRLRDHVVVGEDTTSAGIIRLSWKLTFLNSVSDAFALVRMPGPEVSDPDDLAPFGGRTPKDSGQSAADSSVIRLLEALRLPSVHGVRDLLFLPSEDLLFFLVVYGHPMEVLPGVVGVRHAGRSYFLGPSRNGVIDQADSLTADVTTLERIDARRLSSRRLLDTLEGATERNRIGDWLLEYYLLPLFLSDSGTTVLAAHLCLERILAQKSGCSPEQAAGVMLRAHDLEDLVRLTMSSSGTRINCCQVIPYIPAMRRMADDAIQNAHASRATLYALAALASGERDSAMARRIVSHPRARRDVGILAVLAPYYPWALQQLLELMPSDASVRGLVRGLYTDDAWRTNYPEVAGLLTHPKWGRNRRLLQALANGPMAAFPAVRAEAGRRLPLGELRFWGFLWVN
ncbi:MAG: hypothetical protein ABI765_08905 [Gemmatimonadota bacterium]